MMFAPLGNGTFKIVPHTPNRASIGLNGLNSLYTGARDMDLDIEAGVDKLFIARGEEDDAAVLWKGVEGSGLEKDLYGDWGV